MSASASYLVAGETLDERVGLLQAPEHRHGDAHRQTAQDLLMLRVLGVLNTQRSQHVSDVIANGWHL